LSFAPGHVFAGKYRIEKKLGEGGMGQVYAARHLELGGRVALKIMLQSIESSEASARFNREARAASQLRGEHIVRTLDAGKVTNGSPYIVLEYVDGVDLEQLLTERGQLPVKEAVDLIIQACEGVAEAHALHMVHRDLKPRNMLLTKRPNGSPLLKILDFGVVKISRNQPEHETSASLTLTQADSVIGSVHYMSPEQIHMSSKVDARADVWSLGVCLYRLLTNEKPFDGDTLAAVFNAVLGRPPTPIEELRPDVPPAVARAVERALEKSVLRRFQSVAELAGALGAASGDTGAFDRIDNILQNPPPDSVALDETTPEAPVLDETRHAVPKPFLARNVPNVPSDSLPVTRPEPLPPPSGNTLTVPLAVAPASPSLPEPPSLEPPRAPNVANVVSGVAPMPPPVFDAPSAKRTSTLLVSIGGAGFALVGLGLMLAARIGGRAETHTIAPSASMTSIAPPTSAAIESAPPAIPEPTTTATAPPPPSTVTKTPRAVVKPRPTSGTPSPVPAPSPSPSPTKSPYDHF